MPCCHCRHAATVASSTDSAQLLPSHNVCVCVRVCVSAYCILFYIPITKGVVKAATATPKVVASTNQARLCRLVERTKSVWGGGKGARKESIEVIVTSVGLRFGRGSAANGVYLVAATWFEETLTSGGGIRKIEWMPTDWERFLIDINSGINFLFVGLWNIQDFCYNGDWLQE